MVEERKLRVSFVDLRSASSGMHMALYGVVKEHGARCCSGVHGAGGRVGMSATG